jgi:hypothetical protein
MSRNYSASDMANVNSAIASLESDRASSLSAFIGSPPGSGSGVQAARRMLENLTSDGVPDNLTAQAQTEAHTRAVHRLREITNA